MSSITIHDYETVAASQTAQILGASGATGDYIARLVIVPATNSPGTVALLDGATSITVLTAGTVSGLEPITVELGVVSTLGPWKITTGANVSVIALGDFT